MPLIYVRLLMIMYRKQSANVKWNNKLSNEFSLSNGVKQGAVLSAILFCLYVDDLYKQLMKRRSGCWINEEYYGIIGYSDDMLLVAPSIDALQEMVSTCEEYAKEHNLQFSTDANPSKSKTKCMAFTKRKECELRNILLCSNPLPWVKRIKHLGSVVTNDLQIMADDTTQKRAEYINKNNELFQEFHYTHPASMVKINNYFNTSFYGSVLWDLFGTESLRLEKTWNISMRKMQHLPRKTHRYVLEPISMTKHIIFSLYSRFIKFVDGISCCQKSAMRNLLTTIKHDCRSRTGSNLRKIMLLTNTNHIDEINSLDIKSLVYFEIPRGDEWRLNMIKELSDYKSGLLKVPGLSYTELDDMMNHVCST